MTVITDSAAPSNSTNTLFRDWAQVIHDAFDTAGWIQTADTGQIDLTTETAPTGANEKRGYEIWRMDDALQATAPVFVKIWYGSSAATNRPGLWIEIGEGASGTGLLLGRLYNSRPPSGTATDALIGTAGDSTTPVDVVGSGDPGYIVLGMFEVHNSAGDGNKMMFAIERLTNVDGTSSDEGVVLLGSQNGQVSRHGVFLFGVYNNHPIADSIYIAAHGGILQPQQDILIFGYYIYPALRHQYNRMRSVILIQNWNPGWTSFGTPHAGGQGRGVFWHNNYGVIENFRSFGMTVSAPLAATFIFPAIRFT